MPLFLFPQSPCELEPDAGPCEAAIVRYYYDNNSQDCQTFIWGGCQGNSNRYSSYELCIEACGSTCQLPADQGPCAAAIERWHFDQSLGYCTTFIWVDCGGNSNNYKKYELCREACNFICELPMDPGPCLAAILR
jgi:hypothetical protein